MANLDNVSPYTEMNTKPVPNQINATRNDIANQVASGSSTAMVNPIELQSVS